MNKTKFKKKCYIIDLDGTLILKNTFHLWLKYLFLKNNIYKSVNKNIAMKFHLILFCFLRILKLINHSNFKKLIQKKYSECTIASENEISKNFIEIIYKYINSDLCSFIDLENKNYNNCIYILATAAPEEYAAEISKKINFDYCLATPKYNDQKWYDNIRFKKTENVEKLLKKINLNLNETILFTDHIDDLSLIRKVKKTFAFYPLANNIKFMKNKYKINIIDFYNET